jgi:ABC-type transporter Mla subunit MlaD
MRRILLILALLAAGVATLATSAGADEAQTYEIEMYNAFGIVEGSDVRIAGVNAGSVKELELNDAKRAVVTVELSGDIATLGERTTCSTEPQSLIAEYFIDCVPKGPPLAEDDDSEPDVPANRVSQTVQTDLVQNTLREPYKRRLSLLINEFGTALAGNPEALNEAIRLGAPALTELRKVTKILASQNTIIRDLNVNSDEVIGRLDERREDVVRFIEEALDTSAASAARREDLSRDFELLDDFLAELRPTLVELESLAREQTPLLTDLRAAAPGLNTLALNLPAFNDATTASLTTLGDASVIGKKALRRGRDEIRLLADAGRKAPVTAEALADFVRDIDDPRRAVEIDDRAGTDTGRMNPAAGQRDTKGYTGFESLLNWLYYIVGTTAQFDQVAHSMHVNINTFESGPCGHVTSGRDPETGEVGVHTEDGELTTNILDAARCVQWLGPNQPGINEDLGLPPYDPAVCPNGTEPEAARYLCDPAGATRAGARGARGERRNGGGRSAGEGAAPSAAPPAPAAPQGPVPNDIVEELLGLPQNGLGGLGQLPSQLDQGLQDLGEDLSTGVGGLVGGRSPRGGEASAGGGMLGADGAAADLLDFLFSD